MTGETVLRPGKKYKYSIQHFVYLMIFVIAVQGTYLGYFVGMLTTLEKRFGLSSEKSGWLLSMYDIGHTVAVLIIGYFGSHSHLPRITGIGVFLSAIAMFMLASPVAFFGTVDHEDEHIVLQREMYIFDYKCSDDREFAGNTCKEEKEEHTFAFILLACGQILAGIFAAPFNTIAYVYIDVNIEDKRRSPFLLGLLTSMYAFGPALGFLLSSILNQVYTTLGDPPMNINVNDEHWIGAWWLGFLICAVLYVFATVPFAFFPKEYKYPDTLDPLLRRPHLDTIHTRQVPFKERFLQHLQDLPGTTKDLMKNKVYVSMVIAWMFGSYLIGGYQTFLPKYIETQFGRSASMADVYAGTISVGAIAVSTAIGGWVLTKFNIAPRSSIICLFFSWIVILLSYSVGILIGCDQSNVDGLSYNSMRDMWTMAEPDDSWGSCTSGCNCQSVLHFEPVSFDGTNFYSPCHAGCTSYDLMSDTWYDCACAMGNKVQKGLVHSECDVFYAYFTVMFIGLFFGNLFFMVTMMIVLRSVYDDEKVVALSFASFITNLLGFIPAPIIYGSTIDSACVLWDRGNCVLYDKDKFRISFHITNMGFQFLAVVSVLVCYFLSKRAVLPEEEEQNEYELQYVNNS